MAGLVQRVEQGAVLEYRAPVVTNIGQVTAEWLTAVLRGSRTLARGAVAAFEVESDRGNWSSNATFRLCCSPDAAGERPPRLFLKMVDADLGDSEFFGPSEVDYYTRDYVDVPDAPLLRCCATTSCCGTCLPAIPRH